MITRVATLSDIPLVLKMINSAYRGTEGVYGWTHESHLLAGVRTDAEHLQELLERPASTFLLAVEEAGICGCVHLQKDGDVLYFGMLAVDPLYQSNGVGRFLVNAAREFARSTECSKIRLTVISVRTELIAWYQRCGFVLDEQITPFPEADRFGKTKQALQLLSMELPVQ